MDIRKLQRAIVDGLQDVKAQDIEVFNTEHLSPLFERVIIASGASNRQTKALASSVRETVKSRGMQVLRTEGEANGEWIIVDCGAAVAHIMQPAIRQYYHLEEIWGGKPVRMKLAETAPAARVAAPSPPAGLRADRPAQGAAASRGALAGKTAGKGAKTHLKKVAKAPAKSPAKKAAKTPAKTGSGRAAPGKAAPARARARSSAAPPAGARRRAPPRKPVVRSAGVKSPHSAARPATARKKPRRA